MSSTKDTHQANQAQERLQLIPSPCFCSVTGSIRPSKAQICHHIKRFLFRSQHRLLLFDLIYPGTICQAHMLSFINTLLHTYKVTHIHTWQLPSPTTVFYCWSTGQPHQSNLDIKKCAQGHFFGISWRRGEQVAFTSLNYIFLSKSYKITNSPAHLSKLKACACWNQHATDI